MAHFPYAPLDLVGDIYVGDQWWPILLNNAGDVAPAAGQRVRADTVTITNGYANEQASVSPSKAAFRLGNRDGLYSPRNPYSPFLGKLGRNTPVRMLIRRERDDFARVVSSAWGSCTTGEAWTRGGSAGQIASEFTVNGTAGTHAVPAAAAYRYTRLSSVYRMVVVAVTCQVASVTNVTGGSLEPACIMLRGLSASDYLLVRTVINTAEEVSISVEHFDGTVYHSAVTAISGWSGQPLRVKALVSGQNVRAKVWRPTVETEPYGWLINAELPMAPYSGWIGVRSGVGASNSNSKPVEFRYTAWEVAVPQFAGEIAAWPQHTNGSGTDAYISVDAGGLLRRKGQGSSPLRSTMYRGLTSTVSRPVAYWPCEEGKSATSISSPIPGVAPMLIDGAPAFGTYTDLASSSPLPELRKASLTGDVPPYVATGETTGRLIVRVPSGGTVDKDVILRMFCSGTMRFIDVMYHFGGNLSIKAYNLLGAQVLDTGEIAFNVNGGNIRMQLQLKQNGANIDIALATLAVGQSGGAFYSTSLTAHTFEICRQVVINPYKNLDTVAVGHIDVQDHIVSVFDLYQQFNAYNGEAAGIRIRRLCDEERISFESIGDLALTERMGQQTTDTFLKLVTDAAAVDQGTVYEPPGVIGVGYRTRRSLYRQPAMATTSYRNLSPATGPPIDDDQLTRNDITVSRRNGSSYQAEKTTGPLSVLDPELGGAGRVDTALTVNCYADTQLPYLAGWLLHKGTVDESRFPKLQFNLASGGFAADPAVSAAVLQLAVDDRIVLTNPPDDQPPDAVSQLTRGFTRKIGPWIYTVDVNGAPAAPYQVAKFNAGCRFAPSPDCVLDDDYVAAATALDVASPAGPLWTTDPAQMPIGVRIAGEDIAVTTIAGASTPQTFTAGRAVNTVSKDQLAGTQVQLSDRYFIGL